MESMVDTILRKQAEGLLSLQEQSAAKFPGDLPRDVVWLRLSVGDDSIRFAARREVDGDTVRLYFAAGPDEGKEFATMDYYEAVQEGIVPAPAVI